MTGLSEDEEPELSAQPSAIISNAQVGWLIAELGRQSALHVGSGRLEPQRHLIYLSPTVCVRVIPREMLRDVRC